MWRTDYKDQRKKTAAWEDVVAEIGRDPEGSTAQARWKSLRDTFSKKHRTWKTGAPSGSGASDGKEVRWPYFKLLLFLKDLVDVGSTTSNLPQAEPENAEALLMSMCRQVEYTQDESGSHGSESPVPGTSSTTDEETPVEVCRSVTPKKTPAVTVKKKRET